MYLPSILVATVIASSAAAYVYQGPQDVDSHRESGLVHQDDREPKPLRQIATPWNPNGDLKQTNQPEPTSPIACALAAIELFSDQIKIIRGDIKKSLAIFWKLVKDLNPLSPQGLYIELLAAAKQLWVESQQFNQLLRALYQLFLTCKPVLIGGSSV